MTTIAVLGTGRMGGAIARRLAASGFDLTVWDRTTARAQALDVGRVAPTPAEAIRGAEAFTRATPRALGLFQPDDADFGARGARCGSRLDRPSG